MRAVLWVGEPYEKAAVRPRVLRPVGVADPLQRPYAAVGVPQASYAHHEIHDRLGVQPRNGGATYVLDGFDEFAHDRLYARPLYLEERGPARIVRDDVYGLQAHG